ncbi:MAG TPA: hypothetical protein DEP66_06555 [Acidimicrobiaceae bacterium]|nr:hypothetical protein [Acidimicrobiaceae bacterium]HCB37844.1 hypothetical protein [Acidimicrobiaceae bacterium]
MATSPSKRKKITASKASTAPTPAVLMEIIKLLQDDTTHTGKLFRLRREDISKGIIVKERILGSGEVSNLEKIILALTEGKIPKSTTQARLAGHKCSAYQKQDKIPLQVKTRNYLRSLEEQLFDHADNLTVRKREDTQRIKKEDGAMKIVGGGVYAYSLGHYIRYPYDPIGRRTLIKVGHSSNNIRKRTTARGQVKVQTSLPEALELLEMYTTKLKLSTSEMETIFHAKLKFWSMNVSNRNPEGAGTEWFLINLDQLREIATTLGFDAHEYRPLGF